MKTYQIIKDLLLFAAIVILIFLQFCNRDRQKEAQRPTYKKGTTKRDSVFSNSYHTISGKNVSEIYHHYYTIPGVISITSANVLVPTVTTSIKDTLDDQNLTAFIHDSLLGKVNLIERNFTYKLKIPLVIQNTRVDTVTFPAMHKSKRWGLGIQAGAGITGAGLQPYVGIGISYNLFTF